MTTDEKEYLELVRDRVAAMKSKHAKHDVYKDMMFLIQHLDAELKRAKEVATSMQQELWEGSAQRKEHRSSLELYIKQLLPTDAAEEMN